MNFPYVEEKEDKIIVVYSNEKIAYVEEDDGVQIFYSKNYDVVKIIIPKDEEHHIIYLP
ncbi:hypothetical protein [Aquifex aeolicus]|uniref:hypothetical protein n=1 Tax=Aquifex aeolicus TaxID=63363 RepID=UPI00030C425A|nr:hypothetical protein [Aquifex aeolicus]